MFSGCQGAVKMRTPTIEEKICPVCGSEIEIFSTDVSATCEKCGFTIYNDVQNCVQWCKYARQCVGDEMYEKLMAIAAREKEERERGADAETNH